ncbi:MAG: TetR/AcrR family transcriptional regulator [Woeseia sp.]
MPQPAQNRTTIHEAEKGFNGLAAKATGRKATDSRDRRIEERQPELVRQATRTQLARITSSGSNIPSSYRDFWWYSMGYRATLLQMGIETPATLARTELTKKGSRRVKQILEAAADILIEHGIHTVEKRSVANRLGISDGNVSYYFPTKESLILAVIDHQLEEYYRRHHPESSIPQDDAQALFDDYVRRWIDEYQDPMVRIFFSQIITVAETNKQIARKRDEIYEAFVTTLLNLAQRLEPKVELRKLETRVLTAISVLEGLHAVSAFRPALFTDDPQYTSSIISLVNAIVHDDIC